MTPTAYPLQWPDHIPRATRREAGKFKATLAAALGNVEASLKLFGTDSGRAVSGIVLSSNVTLGQSRPTDPGVAVWFAWDGEQRCIPVDRYLTPAANLQAIHHVLEARRVELRHGTLALVRASMRGFQALPAPGATPWWQVLQAAETATAAEIEAAFRRLARERHPDAGGSHDMMADLNRARAEGLAAAEARR
ncbi:J domain-containing protein [Methylobacterium sp. 17Sr1-1]|uniref:J domain-containing protein n=1 Tax=Methylobacterium sp. 17Sr1-1 TaxID=2202826 RepID=UPI000D6F0AC1|nr:J domain-containing protein [Methylobacterium sp. 17Sr1-1]AWN51596.1 J domain-containing protein [Methylobacterium sp. 17Sr1-1]